jgi:hypothetical protein
MASKLHFKSKKDNTWKVLKIIKLIFNLQISNFEVKTNSTLTHL